MLISMGFVVLYREKKKLKEKEQYESTCVKKKKK